MTPRRPLVLLASYAVALATPTSSGAALDHFLTYRIKDSRGSICSGAALQNVGAPCELETDCGGTEDESGFCVPKGFPKRLRVSLADRFETGVFDVQRPVALATPASANGQGVGDATTQLKAYQIALAKTAPRQPPHVKRTNLLVRNPFHPAGQEIALDTQKPNRLLVPTARSLTGPVPRPDPATHAVDHYKCYTVKPSPNAPAFTGIPGVSIDAPFTTPEKRYDLKKPTRLCIPVAATAVPGGYVEPVEDPNASLLCYQAALAKTVPRQAKHEPVVGIFLANRFGPERVDTKTEDELCVPSLLLPAIGCTADATRACYDGPAGTAGVGVCRTGTQTCGTTGTFGPCTGQVLPTAEIAGDGIDQDCDGADQPDGDPIPPSTVVVDETIRVDVTEIEGFDGAPARPVTALTDRSGIPMHFVANELIVVTDDTGAAAALAARWGGTLVRSLVPADVGLPGAAQHLVRVAPSLADVPQLVADLRALEPGARNDLRVATATGLQLLAAAAREAATGHTVALNVVMAPHGFVDRTTTENMSLPTCSAALCPAVPPVPPVPPGTDGCVCPGIPVPGTGMPSEPFNVDAYTWSYMRAGGSQNIGVGEAWRALSLAGLLGNKVGIAVIDGGFSNLAVDNPTDIGYVNAVNPLESNVYPANTVPCTNGAACPWHGANVVSAAMGPADDAKGAAGPAGPIAQAFTIRRNTDAFGVASAFLIAFASPARIVNMSTGERVPATLSWVVEPFNALTAAVHAGGKLLVASAGNNGADVDSEDCVPLTGVCWEDSWWTPCENDGVFCIGALQGNGTAKASFSNWGNEDVDLFGPGIVWVGGDPFDPEPHAVPGTSISAPFVAGVAALVMAANPALDNTAVEQALVQTAWPSDPDVRRYVNAQGAVNLALGGSPVCTAPQILTSTPDHSTAPCLENVFTVTHSPAFGPFRYQWKKLDPATGALVDVPEGGRVSGSTTDRMTVDPFWPADEGSYAVVVSNLCGSSTSAFVTVTLVAGRVERAPSLIAPRAQVPMAFDRGRGRMVMFGGRTPSSFESNETWERDASGTWQLVATGGPAPRFEAFMAYDEARGVTVLHGGKGCIQQDCSNVFTDTWEWNGTSWTEIPAVGLGLQTVSMIYDPVRQRVVRFTYDPLLYEWNGTAWTSRPTVPDPVSGSPVGANGFGHSWFAFDRTRSVYVATVGPITWEMGSSGQWILREFNAAGVGSPRPSAMVFDSDRGRTLLYSVEQPAPSMYEGHLWEWTGATWLRQPALLPTGEHTISPMAYDSLRQRTVIAGIAYGFPPSADVFEWRYFADDPMCSLGPPL